MFKTLLFSIVFLASTFCFGQYDPFSADQWELEALFIDTESLKIPENDDAILLDVFDVDVVFFVTNVCNILEGGFDPILDNESFTLNNLEQSSSPNCTDPDVTAFEVQYFNFYTSNGDELFTYQIVEDEPGNLTMTITNSFGNQAVYNGERELSVDDFDIASVKLYPNPVNKTLFISSEENKIDTITIFNINGQRIISKENSANSIDVASLSKGLYIVEITSEGRKVFEKFIKN